MRVYLVRCESGEYSDKLSVVEGVFSSEEAAVAYIESQERTFFEPNDYPGELWEPRYAANDEEGDERASGRLVTRVPTRHPRRISHLVTGRLNDTWYVDGDMTYDCPTWFVEEFEVME